MSALSLPQRVARAVGDSPVSERVAVAQELVYGPVIGWARRSPFHTRVLGHSVHPPLTDLTLGCWISASILDIAGGPLAHRGATLLVGAGLAAAGPTAIAGTGDWTEMTGTEPRIGAVHALGTDVAAFLPPVPYRTDARALRPRQEPRPRRKRDRGRSRIFGRTPGTQPRNRTPDHCRRLRNNQPWAGSC